MHRDRGPTETIVDHAGEASRKIEVLGGSVRMDRSFLYFNFAEMGLFLPIEFYS
jgi:hypothetical protein